MFGRQLSPRGGSAAKRAAQTMTVDKIVIVTRKTALEELVLRLNSREQARFYLQQIGIAFDEYERADVQYHRSFDELRRQLPPGIKQQFIDRDLLPTYQFGDHDLVVTLGPDGLVVNTAKYLGNQPILAVNPDVSRIDGILLPFTPRELSRSIAQALEGRLRIMRISMAKATLNDGQVLYGVNDLFIGPRSHISARYILQFGKQREPQSSSGVIVSTGAGCTGWLRSVVAGAWQVANYFGEIQGAAPDGEAIRLGWESDRLWFSVREPFISKTSRADLVFGQIGPGQELIVTSQMPDDGVIFSDGIEADRLTFSSGFIARVGLAERKAHLLMRN